MEVLRTGNLPAGYSADRICKWLVITRSSLLPLSSFAVIIGGLLAARAGIFHPLLWILTALWLLPAQALNQLINDLFDGQQGIDTEDYARTRHSPHPLIHGLTSHGGLVMAVVLLALLQIAVLYVLAYFRGFTVWAFAAFVFSMNLFCVAPPLKLKQRGLGELTQVFLWGPVMTGGAYFMIAGNLPAPVWLATLPYGISVAASLLGLYLDRREMDETRWVLTVPVLLGEKRARNLLQFTLWAYYLLVVGLSASGPLPWSTLFVLVSLPMAVRFTAALNNKEAPDTPKEAETVGAREVFSTHVRKSPSRAHQDNNLPPLHDAFRSWGRRWLRAVTWTFTAGLAVGAILGLINKAL
jgi:1,4-dihydroxy-2-naphthoate octaprenyltransferase